MEQITEKQKNFLEDLINKNVHTYDLDFMRGDEYYILAKIYLKNLDLPQTKQEASQWISALKDSPHGYEDVIMMDGVEKFHNYEEKVYEKFGSQEDFGRQAKRTIRQIKRDYHLDVNQKIIEEITKMINEK